MKKAKLNLVIDGLLLLCLAGIGGIGFLIKYVLVPGYRRWEIYERNVDLFFWGLDRHEWGTIHLIMGFVFLGLMVLHIVLHWDIIVAIYRKLIPSAGLRIITAVVLIFLTVLLLTFGFFIKPEIEERGLGAGHGWRGGAAERE
ncbi:MAG: DUF4405 domain-containing protein [Planctomycetota bacterium]|jgi:hypothetical protein